MQGKAARTLFRMIRYCEEDNTSIIECRPLTGRTHQIRCHLCHLGHPIANDSLNLSARGNSTSIGDLTCLDDDTLNQEVLRESLALHYESDKKDVQALLKVHEDVTLIQKLVSADETIRDGLDASFSDEQLKCRGIWLHALQLKCTSDGKEFCYQVPLPEWYAPH